MHLEKSIRKRGEPVSGKVDHLQVWGSVEDSGVEVGEEVVMEGEVVEAGQQVELVRVEGAEPAPGHHQVGQLGQGGEGGGL